MAHPKTEDVLLPLEEPVISVLVENHVAFRRYLRRHLGSEAAAEDLLQQGFLRAVEKRGSLRDEESVVSWFYKILKNAVIDHYRARSAEERKNNGFLQSLLAEDRGSVASPDDVRAMICECVNRLLPTLKPEYADLLRRIDLQGEHQAEVAKSLEIELNNLMVRLHRARRALRASLEKSCGTCTEHGCLDCTCAETGSSL